MGEFRPVWPADPVQVDRYIDIRQGKLALMDERKRTLPVRQVKERVLNRQMAEPPLEPNGW